MCDCIFNVFASAFREARNQARKKHSFKTDSRTASKFAQTLSSPASMHDYDETGESHYASSEQISTNSTSVPIDGTDGGRPMCLPAHCAQSGDNLYCVQWLNIVRGCTIKTKIYKIGRGASGRETRVHGTNPMRYPIVRKWCTIGHVEKRIHKLLSEYNLKMDGGREWFDLQELGSEHEIEKFLDGCVIKVLRNAD